MSAAERVRKQRAKAMANMTEEQKMANRKKESERQSQLRKRQMARMDKNEKAEFKAKEVKRVTQHSKRKQSDNDKPVTELSNVPLAQNPCKSRQSFGNAINKSRVELLQSPRKKKAVVSGLAKEVGLHLQNEYEKQTHGNTISEELKAEIETFYTRSDISYTMPGAKDEIVIWDSAGKKRRER